MKDLDSRIADRKERERQRLESNPNVLDREPSNHAGEAQDVNGKNLGDGLGPLASTGASGHMGNPTQGDLEKRGGPQSDAFPTFKPDVAVPDGGEAKDEGDKSNKGGKPSGFKSGKPADPNA